MKTNAIIIRDFPILVFIASYPMMANNIPKNWPNDFPTSFKLEMIESLQENKTLEIVS
jgi:hypothetical protein